MTETKEIFRGQKMINDWAWKSYRLLGYRILEDEDDIKAFNRMINAEIAETAQETIIFIQSLDDDLRKGIISQEDYNHYLKKFEEQFLEKKE